MPKPVIYAVGKEFLERDHLSENIAAWEDGQRAPTSTGNFEWWYFDAHFDDGTTAVIVFATKPLVAPHFPLTPNLSLTVTRTSGEKTAQFAFPPADQFSASPERCDVTLGKSWVKQTSRGDRWAYEMHAETADLSADLVFTGLTQPWRPGAGKTYFGDLDHYFAWLPAIPHGSVEGTLTYDGKVRNVKGTGYHDHNWGNIALPSVMDHWTWGRAHLGGYTLIFVEQVAAKKYGYARIPVFLLSKGDQVLADDSHFLTMQAGDYCHHSGGRKYPKDIIFSWAHGTDRIQLTLRQPELIEAVSLLSILPPVKRRLARLFTNPYYFRFNANMKLEINLSGQRYTMLGQALYELMILK